MNKLLPRLMTGVVIALASLNSAAQTAQEASSETWYQIELLVFAYQNPDSGLQEIWPQQPGLHYPQRIVTLSRASASEILLNNPPAADSEAIDGSLDYDENPDTLSTQLEQLPEPALTDIITQQDRTEPQQLLPANVDLPSAATAQQTQQPVTLPAPLLVKLGQQPFTLLGPEQLLLGNAAKRLSRQTDIRPLFHGAWRQPIAERDQAESILIQGGDQYDNHFELEGSISLGLERYLHIKTDLWLSSFVSNAGQPQNLWPLLPPRPISSSLSGREQQSDPFLHAPIRGFSSTNYALHNPFSELAANQYRVDRTVALQQERRMRSDELHYIDHPLIGLLVKITPYEFPLIETVEPDIIDSETEAIDGNDTATEPVTDTTTLNNR